MSRMEIIRIGLNTRHLAGSVVSPSQVATHAVFWQFCSPVRVQTAAGLVNAGPGDCIIYEPGFARRLLAPDPNAAYANNWLFFHFAPLPAVLAAYGLKPNVICHASDWLEITRLLQIILDEFLHPILHSARRSELVFEEILLQLSRAAASESVTMSELDRSVRSKLQEIRTRIYADPCAQWSVPQMARAASISTAWFNTLYKKQYDTTPKQDVINARIECAKNKLLAQHDTLYTIARESGFQNEYYFAKMFKKSTGVTAGQYRSASGLISFETGRD
ncbi:MAG: helix-turn-helix transcriptional regulator [Clostridiaceae bacterium]|nr:helix-turn-helix transcriptional regulator [Clostridiaceae bacterium]